MKTYLKNNKGLFVLPIIILSVAAFIFYILDGATATNDAQSDKKQEKSVKGANYELPEADRNIEILDKKEAYEEQGTSTGKIELSVTPEDTLSIAMVENEEATQIDDDAPGQGTLTGMAEKGPNIPQTLLAHIKKQEQKAREGLTGTETCINKQTDNRSSGVSSSVINRNGKATGSTKKISQYKQSRLVQKQTGRYKQAGTAQNRPVTGIEELDKIFEDNRQLEKQNDSLCSNLVKAQQQLTAIQRQRNSSFTLEKGTSGSFNNNANCGNLPIKAEIHETAKVFSGNRVKLRLLEDTKTNGLNVPKGTYVYGICKVKNERVLIEITQMPVGNAFLPVKISVCDMDGLSGLYVPDNVARKVSQEVGTSASSSPLLGSSENALAYMGIRAADQTTRSLMKRARQKKVTLKKNTIVYLINKN